MTTQLWLALAGLAALVALVLTGHLDAAVIVTYLAGLGLERPSLPTT